MTTVPAWRDGPVTVRVPATSANLGPGFDSFGLALDLCNEVTADILPQGLDVHVEGESADDTARDESHLVVRAARATFAALDVTVPGLRLRCHDRVPHARGLGSSAAAIVAGVTVARALITDGDRRMDAAAVIRLAARLEGHPDNVAAAVLGGFTLAWCDDTGARAVRLEPVVDVTALVPAEPVATAATRRLLPLQVPHADATHTAGRAGLLVAALTGRPDLLLAATEDRLHQPYRASVMPQTAALVARLRAAGHAAVVSGAGPTVLVLHGADAPPPAAPPGWRELVVPVDRQGARVVG